MEAVGCECICVAFCASTYIVCHQKCIDGVMVCVLNSCGSSWVWTLAG